MRIKRPAASRSRGVVPRLALCLSISAAGHGHAAPDAEHAAPALTGASAALESALILEQDAPIFREPSEQAPRRGAAELGARLPVYARISASGCAAEWLMVGPSAWLCSTQTRASRSAPISAANLPITPGDGLPFRYFFVRDEGALGYRDLSSAEQGFPDAEFQPGFLLSVRTIRDRYPGDPFGLTARKLWVPLRDLAGVEPTTFHGTELAKASDVAWVLRERAPVYEKPGGRRIPTETLPRLMRLVVLERAERGREAYLRFASDRWVAARDTRLLRLEPPPPEVLPAERWLDVDIEQQILTAYTGDTPVFATLVSTGKGAPGSELATPKGRYRIWVKLVATDMGNLESEDQSRYYFIQNVPWVMFFERGYGLHGAFWHESFGTRRSHGCVNLAPLDAKWLFDWARPRLPAGWTAVLPSHAERATLVRVR